MTPIVIFQKSIVGFAMEKIYQAKDAQGGHLSHLGDLK